MFGLIPVRKGNTVARSNDFWNIDRVFDEFFNDSMFGRLTNVDNPVKADIRETEKEYIIDAEMPGVDKNDIQLELKDDVLTIGIEQKQEVNEEKDNYIRRERRMGSFKRSFYVENVKNEDVKANYKDGILTVTLPKTEPEKAKTRKIDIQ